MITANFKSYATYVTDTLYQWDLNQKLEVSGLNLASAPEVHFSNADMDRAIVRQSSMENHVVTVDIPNSLLQRPLRIYAHIGIYEGKTFKVVECVEIPVKPKKKPLDYQIEDSDGEIYSFKALEAALNDKATNARVDNIIIHNNDTTGNTELIDMRLGADERTVFASAGSATRAQLKQIDKVSVATLGYAERVAVWSNGNLQSHGVSNRIRTQLLYAKGNIVFDIPIGYRAALGVYENDNDVYTLKFDSGWQENTYKSTYGKGTIYRVVMAKSNDTDLGISCGDGVTIREYFDEESHVKKIESIKDDVSNIESRFKSTRNIFVEKSNWVNGEIQGKNGGVFKENTNNEYASMPKYIPIAPGDYVISWSDTIRDTSLYLHFSDADMNYIGYQTLYNLSGKGYRSFIVPENTAFYRVGAYSQGCTDWIDIIPLDIQIERGTIPTSYANPRVLEVSCLDIEGLVDRLPDTPKKPLISTTVRSIAHRGEPTDYPQCTKPAYIGAKKRGFNIAENDLFKSADGALVMWHDTTLSRLGEYLKDVNGYTLYTDGTTIYYYDASALTLYEYNDGYKLSSKNPATLMAMRGVDYSVENLTLATLKRIDFGIYKGSDFAGTTILTFAEWVTLCKCLGLEIYIDKKITLTESIVSEMVSTLKRYGMINHASWFVWDMTEASLIRNKIANARLVFLDAPTDSKITSRASLLSNGNVVFNPHTSELTAENTLAAIEAGYEVECWHVDYSSYGFTTEKAIFDEILRVCSLGIGGITLDKYSVEDFILTII